MLYNLKNGLSQCYGTKWEEKKRLFGKIKFVDWGCSMEEWREEKLATNLQNLQTLCKECEVFLMENNICNHKKYFLILPLILKPFKTVSKLGNV